MPTLSYAVEMSNAAHSHEALLPTQQAKLVSRLEAFGEIRTYRKGEVTSCLRACAQTKTHRTDTPLRSPQTQGLDSTGFSRATADGNA